MIICHVITGLHNGGAEAVLFRLCTSQYSSNYRHLVISLSVPGIYVEKLEKAGIPVFCLNMPSGRVTWSGLVTLYRLLKNENFDVVYTWMYHADLLGGLIGRLCGIRNIIWGIHNANLEMGRNRFTTLCIVRVCAILSYWIPVRIVSCSQAATVLHQQAGYCKDKFVTIPNGYAIDSFVPNMEARHLLRHKLSLAETIPVLGMVARFDPLKDHNNLLQALSILKQRGVEFVCLLIGPNMVEDNKILTAAIKKYDIKSHLKLLGARDDIPDMMNVLDVHVLSSVGEAFPNVLAEAMACGTPCVTTNVGDAALILGNTGWVVPSRTPVALADAVANALQKMQDRAAWYERQMAARQHIVTNFSLQKMVAAYGQVWESCITQKQNGIS